jgi:hypothetical protein
MSPGYRWAVRIAANMERPTWTCSSVSLGLVLISTDYYLLWLFYFSRCLSQTLQNIYGQMKVESPITFHFLNVHDYLRCIDRSEHGLRILEVGMPVFSP